MLLGAPGVGKGTQARFISERYEIPIIATGSILRAAVAEKTPLGLKVAKLMEKGQLIPDDIMIDIVKQRLAQDDCKNGFLLDGFPRTIAQAEALKQARINLEHVMEVDVPDEKIIKRICGRLVHLDSGRVYHINYHPPLIPGKDDITGDDLVQREDDREDIVRDRIAIYREKTKPLIEYYKHFQPLPGEQAPSYDYVHGDDAIENIRKEITMMLEAKRVTVGE